MFWFSSYVTEVKENWTKTPEAFLKCHPIDCLEVHPHSSHSEVHQTPKPQKASSVSNQKITGWRWITSERSSLAFKWGVRSLTPGDRGTAETAPLQGTGWNWSYWVWMRNFLAFLHTGNISTCVCSTREPGEVRKSWWWHWLEGATVIRQLWNRRQRGGSRLAEICPMLILMIPSQLLTKRIKPAASGVGHIITGSSPWRLTPATSTSGPDGLPERIFTWCKRGTWLQGIRGAVLPTFVSANVDSVMWRLISAQGERLSLLPLKSPAAQSHRGVIVQPSRMLGPRLICSHPFHL